MKTLFTIAFLIFATFSPSHAERVADKSTEYPSHHQVKRSQGGYIAHSFRFATKEGETEGRVLIEKDGLIIATIQGVRAVSFSPTDDILLVAEAVADDDLRHYFLNIGKGQFSRKDARKDYVFGSRYVSKAVWSEDGKSVTLTDQPGLSDAPPTVIKVADKLGK